MNLHLLILCGILFQGIIAALSDQDIRKTSDFLVRKRRVINHLPGGTTGTRMEDAKYIVNIKENNRAHCVGAILSNYNVITAASCVRLYVERYQILSGSAYDWRSTVHNVSAIENHSGNLPHQEYDGIALITVDPPFVYKRTVGHIELYAGPLPAGTHATVSGWGCHYTLRPGPETPRRLRSITLPIMVHEECRNIYQRHYPITEKYLCTYDHQQYCSLTDVGTPLVVNNKMAGIHVWKGSFYDQINPDVFIDLRRADYNAWIIEKTLLM